MAEAVRFVHCAGFRFESRSWEGPLSWSTMRNQDLWQTFDAVLKLCRTEKADLLFLTGDLFEQEYVRKETVERVARSLAKLEGTQVFITPGEKDPLVISSAYRLAQWPDNVHIFMGGLNHIRIPSLGVIVYGEGWTSYSQNKAFLTDFSASGDVEPIRFMLLHAEAESERNSEDFIPLREEQIGSSGLTYLALGHQENWSGIQQTGNTYWADCGQIEARGFGNSGPHGVLLGETDGKLTQISFRELGQRRYIQQELLHYDLPQLLAKTSPEQRQRDLFRFIPAESSLRPEADLESLRKLLTAEFCYFEVLPFGGDTIVQHEFRSESAHTSWDSAKLFPSLSEVFIQEIHKRLEGKLKDDDVKHWELVKKIGLTALSQGKAKNEASSQQGTIVWPENNPDDFARRVRNLKQVGDEEISLTQAWDSLSRAKKKVEDQTETMGEAKEEYDNLRRDWEEANRLQEELRLQRIELKNLQTKKDYLVEKIANTTNIKERLTILHQNPDYRELRRFVGELSRLEELCRKTEAELTAYTHAKQVDSTLIAALQEECLQWAKIQEEVEYSSDHIQVLEQRINEAQKLVQFSPYRQLPENAEQNILQAEKERNAAQKELKNLSKVFAEIDRITGSYREENAKLEDYAAIAEVTEAELHKMAKTVDRLAKHHNSKINGYLNRMLETKLGLTPIDQRLSARLQRYCDTYQVIDYAELLNKQQEYLAIKQEMNNLKNELNQLEREADRLEGLNRIVDSRNQMLRQAFSKVNAADFESWKKGWEEYLFHKSRLAEMQTEIVLHTKKMQTDEEQLEAYVALLREKLQGWESPVSNLDEALAVIMKVARRLRAKTEAEKEFTSLKETYDTQLGKRNMDQLTRSLEPIADLERESYLPEEQREGELRVWSQELQAINTKTAEIQKEIQKNNQSTQIMPTLEKKLETAKLHWKSYEDLQHALEETKEFLEAARQKWESEVGQALEARVQRIIRHTFAPQTVGKKDNKRLEIKKIYFAYCIALKLSVLEDNPDIPLSLTVELMTEPRDFWNDILHYLQELSETRKVIFSTADAELRKLVKSSDNLTLQYLEQPS